MKDLTHYLLIAGLYLSAAAQVHAACNIENRVVFTCSIADPVIENEHKTLTVCLKSGLPDPTVAYQMSDRNDHIELFMERDIRDVHYVNWGGKTRDLHESMSFDRGTYSYQVDITFKDYADDGPLFGSIIVFKNQKSIAKIDCDETQQSGSDESGLILAQLQNLGYKWCAGYGAFGFDEMRYIDCVHGKDGYDQVTGEPAK